MSYVVSGAGNAAVNGLYEDRNSDVNGKPSYTNGSGWYLYYCESEMDIGEFTWVLCDSIYSTTMDFDIGVIYGQTPWNLDTPADGTWYVGYWAPYNTPPAPTVSVYTPPEPGPFDPIPEPDPEEFPEPELYPDELDTAEITSAASDMFSGNMLELLWTITRYSRSTFDMWRNGIPFIPSEYHNTRDFSEWRSGAPFIRWVDEPDRLLRVVVRKVVDD